MAKRMLRGIFLFFVFFFLQFQSAYALPSKIRVDEIIDVLHGKDVDTLKQKERYENYKSREALYFSLESITGKGEGALGEIPLFLQSDPLWRNFTYYFSGSSTGTPIWESGCGPTAYSMVVSGLLSGDANLINVETFVRTADMRYGRRYQFAENRIGVLTPDEAAMLFAHEEQHISSGTTWAAFALITNQYFGELLTCEQMAASPDRIQKALEEEKVVILRAGEGYFTSKGHYIVLTGLKMINGEYYARVNDPNQNGNLNGRWIRITNGDFIAEKLEEGDAYYFRLNLFQDGTAANTNQMWIFGKKS